MPSIEERLQALEQENAARKKTEELLTIAVRALVSKEAIVGLQITQAEHTTLLKQILARLPE